MPSAAGAHSPDTRGVALGLGANWRQFSLLVAINAFVGAMVGLERTVLPLIGEADFGLASRSAVLSFIATFGLVKAVTNWFAGAAADRVGRKRLLVVGWVLALPVPILVMLAPTWTWIVLANVLLGASQGLTWSITVIMKVDLVGPQRRGLAMGLNEFAGYVAVGLSAFATGAIAQGYGLRPEPFYLGVAFAAAGLALSALFVRDTAAHVGLEASRDPAPGGPPDPGHWRATFARVSWGDPAMMSCSQAGLVNNLNDGVAWGLFPLLFATGGVTLERIGILAAAYPVAWGVLQLGTGALSDRWGRKPLIAGGMWVQALALAAVARSDSFGAWLTASVALGAGTAMVYPTLLAAIGDRARPGWRGSAVGVYRFWRDLGYVAGAVVGGWLADVLGLRAAVVAVAALTAASGLLVAVRMRETLPAGEPSTPSALTSPG